ncbi:MAG: N-6 DNA methylase, partial [Actinobacteria bacterium]|nr:N-6 DNA methylase [Actinomycetota bacterium]
MTANGAIRGASAAFRDYLTEVGRDLAAGNATEHTHRPALKALLIALDPDVRPVNEPRRIECGAPDYIVTRNDLPVGYIEAKDVGRSLDEIERDEQLKRYRESLSNLILTDYLEFRWFKDGEKQQTARIAYVGDSGKLRPDREGQKQAAAMFGAFLAQEPPIVGKPEDLAKRMAALTRIVRDIVRSALEHDRSGGSPLREQLEGFRRVLIHDLGEEQFADMYAQTIAYGLFAARVNAPADEHFSRQHAAYDLPKTNPFLRQMFGQIAGPELDERIAWAVDDLAELLARARMDLVLEDFGKRTRQEDPVVHFYETFLAAYDRKMREARGVYYTPEPVVSYIVRSVDHILKTEFGLPDGLADNSMIEVPVPGKPKETRMVHKVQILDPACGTGTFLAQVIETIRDTVVAKHGAGMWPGYVHDHLLPRLYGFELLMAPYAIAHLKLGLRLKETGYDIEQSERLRVYLTNSLEEAHEREHGQLNFFGNWLAEEADRASEVKRELPIMVILGNPPYSGQPANTGEWITQLLHGVDGDSSVTQADYFSVDGGPLGENNPKWLYDDYVKFIRFAQWRVEKTGAGVVGLITNHGFLSNPTFRGMRQSLMQSFDSLYLLDMHGNAQKREKAPDGGRDENVFDISVGAAVSLLVSSSSARRGESRVLHADLWGVRGTDGASKTSSGKYGWLADNTVATTAWTELEPRSPFYLLVPHDTTHLDEYQALWRITDVMPLHSNGLITSRDKFVFGFSKDEVARRVADFAASPLEESRVRYGLRDVREMPLEESQR